MKKNVFIFLLLIYFLLYLIKHSAIKIDFVSAYLADIIAVPVIILLLDRIMNYLYGDHFKTSTFHILSVVISLSIVFEIILPTYSANYYADFYDIICYFTGGVMIYLFLNHPFVLKTDS